MGFINFYEISTALFQLVLVNLLLLLFFRVRKAMGIGLLFTALGLFQFLQVFLASTVYLEIAPDTLVSPGSIIIFTSTLFAILLVYIKEGAVIYRNIIYALIVTNFTLTLLLFSFSVGLKHSNLFSIIKISPDFFDINARVLIAGSFALILDSWLLIFLFEYTSKLFKNLFFRFFCTLLIVVAIDSFLFTFGAFYPKPNIGLMFLSGFLSKGVVVFALSGIYSLYILYYEKTNILDRDFSTYDIFKTLTYKQKFEKAEQNVVISEAKYKNLTNISPVGIFLTDNNGKTLFVNPKWSEISGLSFNEALNDEWLTAVHPEDREALYQLWLTTTSQKKPLLNVEFRFLRPDGSIAWVLSRANPELDLEGIVTGYVGTITDITPLKLYEEQLHETRKKAEESDRLKSIFLANMSHEIRTPMNGILGFAEMLKADTLSNTEKMEYINIIEKSGHRMLTTINNIIDVSKIEAGQESLKLVPVYLNMKLKFIYNFFKPEAERKGLTMSIANNIIDDKLIIKTDKNKLNAILTNLVKNAIKYTDTGIIEFGYHREGKFLKFFVKDTGIGIPLHKQTAIFNRFVQAEAQSKKVVEGSGLGLTISKAYAHILGGDIWVESTPNEGTTFYFTIPFQQTNFFQEEDDEEDNLTLVSQNTSIPILKTMIAEDDTVSKKLMGLILKDYSNDITYVSTGLEAVEEIRKNPDFDLILMDIRMPEMDGNTAASIIKKEFPNVKIIAQSAHAIKDEIRSYKNIFDDYITKPINKKDLQEKIEKLFI